MFFKYLSLNNHTYWMFFKYLSLSDTHIGVCVMLLFLKLVFFRLLKFFVCC